MDTNSYSKGKLYPLVDARQSMPETKMLSIIKEVQDSRLEEHNFKFKTKKQSQIYEEAQVNYNGPKNSTSRSLVDKNRSDSSKIRHKDSSYSSILEKRRNMQENKEKSSSKNRKNKKKVRKI